MATYYVTQAGAGDGSTVGTPDSVADFNADVFGDLADDTVIFLGTITTGIVIPRSGTSGHVIMIKGDDPNLPCIIDTSHLIASGDWTADDPVAGTYSCNIATIHSINYCNELYEDNLPLVRGTDAASLTAGQFFYDGASAHVLYYRPSTGTPAAHTTSFSYVYSYHNITGCNWGIKLNGKSYITLDNITLRNNGVGLLCLTDAAASDYVIVQNCRFTTNVLSDRVLLSTNTASYHTRYRNHYYRSAMGICPYEDSSSIYLNFDYMTYTYNEFEDIGTLDGTNVYYNAIGTVALNDVENIGMQRHSNTTITNNYLHGGIAYGIYFYQQANAANVYNSTGNFIQCNRIENITKSALYVGGDGTVANAYWGWSGNTFANNYINGAGTLAGDSYVLKLSQSGAANATNYYYNNTIVGGGYGVYCPSNTPQYINFVNNIFSGQTVDYWFLNTNKTEVSATYNIYSADTNSRFYYNGTNYASFAAWSAAGLDATGSLIADPLLTTYILLPDSPCIRAGLTLDEVTNDIDGRKRPGRPGNKYSIGCWEYLGTNDPDHDENCRLPYR